MLPRLYNGLTRLASDGLARTDNMLAYGSVGLGTDPCSVYKEVHGLGQREASRCWHRTAS